VKCYRAESYRRLKDMETRKSLDDYITEMFTEVYRHEPKRELRWCEIRNTLMRDDGIPLEERRKFREFGVKVSRRLLSLAAFGILEKHDNGHRNVTYSLRPDWKLNILKEKGLYSYGATLALDIKPGDTYEQFKRKGLKAMMKQIEEIMEPDMKKAYEEMKEKWRDEKK
jgi:hypothetical protein